MPGGAGVTTHNVLASCPKSPRVLALCCVLLLLQATMYSLVGLLLVYLGTSWLLMHFASEFTSTKQDLSERKRMAKSSSTGEALYNPGRVSPSADAAIDIRGDDSPIGYKGPSTAMARGAHHEYPFVQNVVADGRASAQRGGGAGTRLPCV